MTCQLCLLNGGKLIKYCGCDTRGHVDCVSQVLKYFKNTTCDTCYKSYSLTIHKNCPLCQEDDIGLMKVCECEPGYHKDCLREHINETNKTKCDKCGSMFGDLTTYEECRLCLQESQTLIKPCKCREGIHIECLEHWISKKHRADICELCKSKYNYGKCYVCTQFDCNLVQFCKCYDKMGHRNCLDKITEKNHSYVCTDCESYYINIPTSRIVIGMLPYITLFACGCYLLYTINKGFVKITVSN